jgi:anaerobic ribonucleoside-triphosphate reductase
MLRKHQNLENSKRTPCEIWTRVMGYHRPVANFNIGKKAEHYSRKHFSEVATCNHAFAEKFSTSEL